MITGRNDSHGTGSMLLILTLTHDYEERSMTRRGYGVCHYYHQFANVSLTNIHLIIVLLLPFELSNFIQILS